MAHNPIEHRAQLSRHPEVSELLYEVMPKLQPSALKHVYVNTVANVLNNPIAEMIDREGCSHIIGFGDADRKLPIKLILEPEPDRSVRHAFPPKFNQNPDYDLMLKLQKYEDDFARLHKLPHRDILTEMRMRNPQDISEHGLSGYNPYEDFSGEYWKDYRANFYRTDYMPSERQIIEKPIMYEQGDDYYEMLENIKSGFDRTYPEAGLAGFDIDTRSDAESHRKTMHVTNARVKLDDKVSTRVLPHRATKRIRPVAETLNFRPGKSASALQNKIDRLIEEHLPQESTSEYDHTSPAD